MKFLHHYGMACLGAVFIGFSSPTWAAKMLIQCQTLTEQGRLSSIFNPDQPVNLRLKLSIPDQRIQKEATFSVKGIAQRGGLRIPYKIDSFDASVPVGRDGLDIELSKRVKIPDILSGSEITLQVTTAVQGFRDVKCSRRITIR